jgi:hypothetical protein
MTARAVRLAYADATRLNIQRIRQLAKWAGFTVEPMGALATDYYFVREVLAHVEDLVVREAKSHRPDLLTTTGKKRAAAILAVTGPTSLTTAWRYIHGEVHGHGRDVLDFAASVLKWYELVERDAPVRKDRSCNY